VNEIVVVDDGSRLPVSKMFSKLFPGVRVLINERNLGFAKSINRGVRESTGDIICLLNNDIRLPNKNWLHMMLETLKTCDMAGCAMGRLSLPNYEYLPGEIKENAKISKKEFCYCPAYCSIISRRTFDEVGGMPEEIGKFFFEDALFWYRAEKMGKTAKICEGTGVEHFYHKTFKMENIDLQKEYQIKHKIFLDLIQSKGIQ
jgi:GT2 family glycosyltransferase